MKHTIKEIIEIEADAQTIWKVLTDTPNYKVWNPFISSIEGELVEGQRVNARIGGMKFKPLILTFTEAKVLKWIGHLFIPGIFDGEHHFIIEELEKNRCRFIQKEHFKGLLVGLFRKKLDKETKPGFRAMNVALKERCEAIVLRRHEVS